jgi:hypothetical protein
MRANDRDTLHLLGEQVKVTTTDATNRARLARLNDYLHGLPHYNFTEKGQGHICQCFSVSADELAAAVAAIQTPRLSRPTPELLRVIGTAIRHSHQAKGGAAKW